MIYGIGDSHCTFCFRDIPNAAPVYCGPITLKRVGYLEDSLIPDQVKQLNLRPTDTIFFCFGEIDIRCFVKPILQHRKITMQQLLQDWVDRYSHRIATLHTNGAKLGIMSVVPPTTITQADSKKWPVAGTDDERVVYTQTINTILAKSCLNNKWIYLDVYSRYADERGMLPIKQTAIAVHIKDNIHVKELLVELGLS